MEPTNSASHLTHNELRDEYKSLSSKQKHKVFLSHSGVQKAFVEHLCVDLERCLRFPFFDKRQESLPIGKHFPKLIFDAIPQCSVGVVILSEEFFTSKWPMMEFVAMVDHAKKDSTFTIIPVYFRISIEEFKDPMHRTRWLSCWEDLALEDPRSVNIENWVDAMKYIQPINSPKYDGLSELKLLKEVVDAVCKLVPADVKLEDSYIQGRSRLCKVIHEKIDMEQGSRAYGVSLVGLYGMGGIGKTSICKALCNENSTRFRGRVCLVELEKRNEEELLREVVQSLSDRSQFYGLSYYQLQNGLREGTLIKEAVFLVLDNMIDSHVSLKQVEQYLSAKLPSGSVVMVTTRSKDLLFNMRKYFNPNNCMEMPELNLEEAKTLFVKSCNFGDEEKLDDRLIERCVMRCCFQKDDLYKSDHGYYQGYQNYPIYNDDKDNDNYYNRIRQYAHHYHPLALEVLGRELGQIARSLWNKQLRNIDEDIFNQTRGNIHPIFSILRKSFDTLSQEDQLLFMDVALFLHHPVESGCNVFEWLSVVHNIPSIANVKSRLERLKTKSLLERLHDGTKTRIGMHDLWRSFCVAETKYGKLKSHRWAYVASRTPSAILYTTPPSIWENVQRMAFMGFSGYTSTPLDSPLIIENALRLLNFAHFSNVLVLKMLDLSIKEIIEVDLSGLIHLKSFEVSGKYLDMLGIRGLPRSLVFFSFIWGELKLEDSAFTQYLLKQIEALKELEYLQLINYGGEKLPNLSNMVNLRKVIFKNCKNVVTFSGLRTKVSKISMKNLLPKAFQRHTNVAKQIKVCSNFQVLDLQGCSKLQSCSGIGDLVALEELNCKECVKLERLPDLRRLTKLRKLNIQNCYKISEVLGLGELVALVELHAGLTENLSTLFKVPNLHNLRNLQVLQFENRRLEGALGFDRLHSLREVVAEFQNPMSFQVTKLEKLKIGGCTLAGLKELCKFTTLESLEIGACNAVNGLPNLDTLYNLQSLKIVNCNFNDVFGLSNLSTLARLQIEACHYLESVPDLLRLTRLKTLEIGSCSLLKDLNSSTANLSTSMDLQSLSISHCQRLGDMTSIGTFSQLETLECWECGVMELPNLSNFRKLKNLILWKCEALETLAIEEPINSLSILLVHGCGRLVTLPDLCNFPALLELRLEEGKVSKPLTTFSCSVPLTMLQLLLLHCETTLHDIDIGVYFPALKEIDIQGSVGLKTLRSSNVPLTALQVLKLSSCLNLTTIPHLKMFPALRSLDLFRCRRLLRLYSTDHVPILQEVDARECLSLSPDDLYQLQVLCQGCYIKYKDSQ